jgi:ABC-type ATPase with predicted acetyltransferase domain
MKISCAYELAPKKPTCNTHYVQTVFGIGPETGRNVIADEVDVPYSRGSVVLFLGPSGSGKSSLLRAAARQVEGAVPLRESFDEEAALIDTLGDDPRRAAHLLSLCGLAEAFLMLRGPRELSDGQRYRYALARCIASGAGTVVADEWCAKLDRTTARVISRNVRKIADKQGVGLLAATTHEDLTEDLCPDVIVCCRGGGVVEVRQRRPFRGNDGFLREFDITAGTLADWPHFARWHYRKGGLGPVKWVYVLWHGQIPAGICLVGPSPLAARSRSRHFPLPPRRGRRRAAIINSNFASVTRLVIAPEYRGAGLAWRFLAQVARMTPRPWIELVSEMADLVPFCEAAGFKRIGRAADRSGQSLSHLAAQAASGRLGHCGGRKRPETLMRYFRRARFSRPVHYIFDNRANCPPG